MDSFEPQLVVKKEVRFSESLIDVNVNPEEHFGDVFGGIIKSGQWGWLTKSSRLRIISLRTGQLISKFEFDESNGFARSIITCVSEIQLPYVSKTIIAIGIQYTDCAGGLAVIYSIEDSTVVRCIELKHKITCCKFISHELSRHTVLQNMNGCLAVGTDEGSVVLVDLNLQSDEILSISKIDSGASVVPCHIVDYSMSLLHLHRHFQHCQQEGVHFGIQLEVLENAEFIQSLLPIDLILGLAVGLADGRLALYDLTDMQLFYVAPPQEKSSPLVKLNFMEPPDDPRSCVYIWAFHENYQNSVAVMHSLMYEKRVIADDGFSYFENFQVSCVRLLLPLSCPKSVPITCQAISKAPSHGNEDTISLCALVWKQDNAKQTEVMLFDINQWYKEEMPYVGDWREDPSYLASFIIKSQSTLEMYFNPKTISLFNSIQRAEEHFYPVSLSFDALSLEENSCVHLNWPGAQNRVISILRMKGSLALLDPNPIFGEILNTRLLPQFSKLNYKSAFSLKAKRETLLSVALEQNCIGLLKECARNWSDGSHQGKSLFEGVSLSTLTDWLWTRALSIKERCNTLCQVLFDHSGCTLDQREQKELGYISKQLKILAELLNEIISKYGQTIPTDVLSTLESQQTSIQMASEYQEILLWLLNIGLLPEAERLSKYRDAQFNHVPYPYESLHRFYGNRRVEFSRLNEKPSSRKTRSCYLLFIDSYIEHEFQGNTLRDCWQESGGDGLYPPTSIQAMLRIMLIPDVTFEDKCALFLYFFLDLNTAIEDKRYEPIVQNFIKFPSVFKLSASLIKQIQAFWNLDHCRFQAAVDEFISPFNKDQVCPQWQFELFIESLLAQNEANLALRVLEAKSSPISPVLQLNTYLANDLISEAFHFARSKQDEDLLKLFFTGCLVAGKFGVIRDLALTENEGNIVQSLLKNSKSRNAENLHFVYLLQKYKYIEAVSYLDELSKGRVVQRSVDVDTPNLVLSAYNTTMTPVTKGLSDVYFKIKNKIKSRETEQNSPYPLSCQLIKQNANDLLGGIYHSSALSAHFASHYWGRHHGEGNALQQSTNAPFLRRPQVSASFSDYNKKETISYPDPYKAAQKRRLDFATVEEERSSKMQENPKKRRKIYDLSNLDAVYKPLNRDLPNADNLLTYLKNTPTRSQSAKKFQKTPQRDTEFLLDTPYIKNSLGEKSESIARSRVADKPETSLHGILKISHTKSVESDRGSLFDSERRDEEKSIRFVLPPVEDESEDEPRSMNEQQPEILKTRTVHVSDVSGADAQQDSFEMEDFHEQATNNNTLRTYFGPAKRKSLRSMGSSYALRPHVIGSRSPLRKSASEESEEQPPSKLRSVETDAKKDREPAIAKVKPVIHEEEMASSDEEQEEDRAEDVVREASVGIEGGQTSFSTRWASQDEQEDLNVTTTRPGTGDTGRTKIGDKRMSDKGFYSRISGRPSVSANRSAYIRTVNESSPSKTVQVKLFDDDRKAQPFQTVYSPVKTVKARQPIGLDEVNDQARKNEVKITKLSPRTIYTDEPKMHIFESEASSARVEKIVPIVVDQAFNSGRESADDRSSTAERIVRLVPLSQRFAEMEGQSCFSTASDDEPREEVYPFDKDVEWRIDQKYSSPPRAQFTETATSTTATTSKRPISEGSDEPEPLQRSVKQLKGRASIHSSPESDENKEQVTQSKPQQVLQTETLIDFRPHVSSSRVFPLESKLPRTETSEISNVRESESHFHLESFTSKQVLSERTTVVGGSTFMPTFERSEHVTETVNVSVRPRNQTLDTTVDMTLDDTVCLDTSQQQEVSSDSSDTGDSLDAGTDSMEAKDQEDDDEEEEEVDEEEGEEEDDDNEDEESENEHSYHSATNGEQIVIEDEDVEEEEEESDGVDILEKFSEDSYSNQFDEGTKTSVSSSLPSTTIHVEGENREDSEDTTQKELMEGVDYDEISLNVTTASTESNTDSIKGDKPTEGEISSSGKEESKQVTSEANEEEQRDSIVSEPVVTESEVEPEKEKIETQKRELLEKPSDQDDEQKSTAPKKLKLHEAPEKETSPGAPVDIIAETNTNEAESAKTTAQDEDSKQMEESEESQNKSVEDKTKEIVLNFFDDSGTQISTVTESDTKDTQESVDDQLTVKSVSAVKPLLSDTEAVGSPRSRRQSRSGSVPPSPASQIVTRRRSMLLDKLDENAAPDSPSSRTRSKCRSESIDMDVDSPSVSHVKRTRLSSVSSATSVEHLVTPKSRRRSSMSVDKELSNTPKAIGTPRTTRGRSVASDLSTTPKRTPRRLSTSSKKDTSPVDLATTTRGTSQKREEEPKVSPEITSSEDYVSSRRLTRTQQAVLEKSAAIAKQMASSPARVVTRRSSRTSDKLSPPTVDVRGSDTESIASQTSHLSTASRRITRSLALKEHMEDDVISIASSTESARRAKKRTKEAYSPSQSLTMIVEEDDAESVKSTENSESSKKSRRRKK